MLKRYLVLSVATAAFSLPSLVYAAQQNILSVHILNQQTGKPAADDPERQTLRSAEVSGADRPYPDAAPGDRQRSLPQEHEPGRPRHLRHRAGQRRLQH